MGKRPKNKVHIGEEIKKILRQRKISIKNFADAIHYSRQNVYHLFGRQAIESDTLAKISVILNYDFMSLYYEDNKKTSFEAIKEATQLGNKSYIINLQLDLTNPHHIKVFNEYMQGSTLKLR